MEETVMAAPAQEVVGQEEGISRTPAIEIWSERLTGFVLGVSELFTPPTPFDLGRALEKNATLTTEAPQADHNHTSLGIRTVDPAHNLSFALHLAHAH